MAQELTAQNLAVAARGIDLTSSVLKSSNLDLVSLVAHASTSAADEIVKWLSRERISDEAFVYSMSMGQNLAQPNTNGLEILDGLERTSSRLYGLRLIMPGALGRTIVYDEQLRWIGTTEVVILKYHPPTYAVEALCNLFASTNLKEDDPRIPAVKARIRPVISKMVDSLHLHTVNIGQRTQPLPACIEALPKHYLADFSLSGAIRRLASMADGDVIVQMNCCIVELVDWIFHHWIGKLIICINNEIAYDKQLGDSEQTLTMLIENKCTADTNCHEDTHIRKFEIGKRLRSSSQFTGRVYQGITDPGIGSMNESSYRSSLYDIRNPFRSRHCYLNLKEQKAAEKVAQDIVRSIIELPVSPINTWLGFKVDKKSTFKYRWWLKKTPTILQKNLSTTNGKEASSLRASTENWSAGPSSRLLFDEARQPQKDGGDKEDDDVEYTTGQIAKWYPKIYSGLELVFERCECGCNSNALRDNLERELDSGCLLALMFAEMMLHIAHAMAEAAGASDASNLQGVNTANSLPEAVVAFIGSIAHYGEIFWDTWFRLAASVITGLPYDMASERTVDVGGGIFLWVAGSMTIVPMWFTLDSEIRLQGSWGVQQMTGSVQGLEAETAVIESQLSSTATSTDIPPQVSTSGGEDTDSVQIETAIFSNTGDLYRIISMVRTNSALRILNPLDVYRGAILAVRPICTHDTVDEAVIHPWMLNDILLGWNSSKTPDGEHAHIALLENSRTKQNVAIGFAAQRSVLQGRNCCFRCLANTTKEKGFYGISCGTPSPTKK
jgi:hypothetical protein